MSDKIRDEQLVRNENDPLQMERELTTADLTNVEGHRESQSYIESTPLDASSLGEVREVREISLVNRPAVAAATVRSAEEQLGPLFVPDEANDFRGRWDAIQGSFVDEPRHAVEEADRLIAATMTRLTEIFAEERQKMERQWDRGADVSTEELRLALRRYRSFFSRLLSV